MPYEIRQLQKGVYINAYGLFSIEESIESNALMFGDPRFDLIEFEIGDFTKADLSQLKIEDATVVSKLELSAMRINRKMKIANVTTDEKFTKILQFYGELLKETCWEFKIFNNVEEAKKWVGLL